MGGGDSSFGMSEMITTVLFVTLRKMLQTLAVLQQAGVIHIQMTSTLAT
jgi:hypothetical protein